jgi:hypothetical protein
MNEELRDTFGSMDPYRAQEIREAYYKAIEGRGTLAEMLGADSPALAREQALARETLDLMRRSAVSPASVSPASVSPASASGEIPPDPPHTAAPLLSASSYHFAPA